MLSRYTLSKNILELIVREKRRAQTKPVLKVRTKERSFIISVVQKNVVHAVVVITYVGFSCNLSVLSRYALSKNILE